MHLKASFSYKNLPAVTTITTTTYLYKSGVKLLKVPIFTKVEDSKDGKNSKFNYKLFYITT